MGYIRPLVTLWVMAAIPLAAILVHFHLKCKEEAAAKAKDSSFSPFDPSVTDVNDYPLIFTKKGTIYVDEVGVDITFRQFIPCPVIKLLNYVTGHSSIKSDQRLQEGENEVHNVNFLDARKRPVGKFKDTGFTLITLESEPETVDWRTKTLSDENADVTKFFKQMEPHIKELYPEAKRLVWTFNVIRGGDAFGDQYKVVDRPHLDYHQDLEARIEFHNEHPTMSINKSEPNILMGSLDTDESKFGVMLGLWKPLTDAVCDNPLAVMDASTFQPQEQTINKRHFNYLLFMFNNLNGGIVHNPRQRWYYFPFQTKREVLVFHQYSADRFFANPHTSFSNKNCPEDSVSRVSVEVRLALFF